MSQASKPRPEEPSKADRLAAALRQNLKRRKAQARAKQGAAKDVAAKTETDKSPLK